MQIDEIKDEIDRMTEVEVGRIYNLKKHVPGTPRLGTESVQITCVTPDRVHCQYAGDDLCYPFSYLRVHFLRLYRK